MNAFGIAKALGRACREGRGWRTNCPAHGGFSLNISDGRDGKLLVHCWGGCDPLDVLENLRNLDLHNTWQPDRIEQLGNDNIGCRTNWARRIWDRAKEARRSPVEAYLRGRGITIAPPPSLRWAPHCKHPSGVFLPAMIARVVNTDGELVGIHRTFLTQDGSGKAAVAPEDQKMSLGSVRGGAVRLGRLDPDRALVIGEGIESTLSLMQLRGLPGWAALGTSGLRSLILPRAATRILIAVDHDSNGAGEAAAWDVGQRWLLEEREVRLAMPTGLGDWNDVLRGQCDA